MHACPGGAPRPGDDARPRAAAGGNAVDRRTAQELADAFRAFDADDDARSGCCAARARHFCARRGSEGRRRGRAEPAWSPTAMGRWARPGMLLSKPVIAAIAGHAVAGGLELALWCDLRVADEDAVLGVFCRRWGVPLIDGGTVRLPRLIGLSRALDLILTGRAVGAHEALAIGLVEPRRADRGGARGGRGAGAGARRLPQECLRHDRAVGVRGAVAGLRRRDGERVRAWAAVAARGRARGRAALCRW